MRLVHPARLLPPRLVAAAIVFAAGAVVVASGQACDKHASARSACPMSASCPASSCTASMCGPAKSASAAVAAANHACSPRTTAVIASRRAAAPARVSAVTRTATAARASKATRRALAAATTTAAPRTATAAGPHAAGLVVVIDPATGGIAKATPDQLRDLAAGIKTGPLTLAARPTDPEVIRWADGTLVSPVPDRFTMFAMGHRDARGKISFDCSHEPGAPAPPVESTSQTWEVK